MAVAKRRNPPKLRRISPSLSTEIRNKSEIFADMLLPVQIKMARAALGLSVRELAEKANVADSTILRFETNKGGLQAATRDRLQAVLESEGVIFLGATGDYGPGVRLARP